jgi:hypothetical protein
VLRQNSIDDPGKGGENQIHAEETDQEEYDRYQKTEESQPHETQNDQGQGPANFVFHCFLALVVGDQLFDGQRS